MALRKVINLALAFLAAGAFLAGAGVSVAAHTSRATLPILRLDYFAAGLNHLAKTLDPALVANVRDAETIQLTNAGLVRLLPNGRVAPDLAAWTVSKNHLVYTFTIRRNARFSNGHPVTAGDAAYSIKRALAPFTASEVATMYLGAIKGAIEYNAGKAQNVRGLKILSKRRLQITVRKPTAYFLTQLAYPTGDVLDRSVLGGKIAAATGNYLTNDCFGNQGAGAFMFRCWKGVPDPTYGSPWWGFYPQGGSPSYTFEPNRHYYGRKPRIQVKLPSLKNPDDSLRTYLDDKLDATPLPPQDIFTWRGKSRQYLAFPSSTITFLTPNVHMPPFDDVHCRRAAAYAVDREKLNRDVFHGLAHPLYSLLPRGLFASYRGNDNPHYNIAKARVQLARCSERNVPLGVTYFTGTAERDSLYSTITTMINAAGFHAQPLARSCNLGCFPYQPLDKSATQVLGTHWQQDYPDPADYADLLRCGADVNLGLWCNKTYDRLADRAAVEWNPAKRARLYARAQHVALNDGALITLLTMDAHELVKPYVHGLVGTEVSTFLLPKHGDWSNVSISR